MTFLITNDDGISSPLLRPLVAAFQKLGEVIVAAPSQEQSWVSKRMTRFDAVEATEVDDFPCLAFAISGSPADCVNLALAHLLPRQPDCIVSGINVGHNAGLTYILSSGTIGAALEGSLHNIPAFAASMGLCPEDYQRLAENKAEAGAVIGAKANRAAQIVADFVSETLPLEKEPYGIVHSLNFPRVDFEDAPIVRSVPALTDAAGFFQKNDDGRYRFTYRELPETRPATPSDRETLVAGHISHTRLDFSRLGTF